MAHGWRDRKPLRNLLATGLLLALAACGSGGQGNVTNYVGGDVALECAPFARALSGVALRGPADGWWDAAAGRYQRSPAPEVGSVLVFRESGRLPSGHVAVVSDVLQRRRILVTQANWVHHRITADQAVIDVSPGNDWSVVRVFWPPSGSMGSGEYPAYGFIRAARPASHDQIGQATRHAIRVALGE